GLVGGGFVLARRRPRPALGVALVAAVVLPAAVAGWARAARGEVVLEVWGRGGLAARAIELAVDVGALRGRVARERLAPAARPDAPRHDVVLVTIDTLRADQTPAYGGGAAMPHL